MEKDMEEIDEAIVTHSKIIENLRNQRMELVARKGDWEMQEVFECAVENGLSPDEMMAMVLEVVQKRKNNKH